MPYTLRSFREGFMYMLRDLGSFFLYLLPWLVVTGLMLKASYLLGCQDRFVILAIPACLALLVLFPRRLGVWLGLFRPDEKFDRIKLVHAFMGCYMLAVFINLGCNPWLP
ncbi:MAG TPA: hypothetical protein VHP58_06030 [Alphaproteobacteria bacterium]|nr:hypothetical protein [Alphaproteobacteria bacterium]